MDYIYIVTGNNYADYCIKNVWSDREKAIEEQQENDRPGNPCRVEVWPVDDKDSYMMPKETIPSKYEEDDIPF